MTALFCNGTVEWTSYKMGLRPNQIAVRAQRGGFVFCSKPPKTSAAF